MWKGEEARNLLDPTEGAILYHWTMDKFQKPTNPKNNTRVLYYVINL